MLAVRWQTWHSSILYWGLHRTGPIPRHGSVVPPSRFNGFGINFVCPIALAGVCFPMVVDHWQPRSRRICCPWACRPHPHKWCRPGSNLVRFILFIHGFIQLYKLRCIPWPCRVLAVSWRPWHPANLWASLDRAYPSS